MNVLDTFEEDETYKCFLSTDYDAEKYANSIIASSTVSQTLQSLQVCLCQCSVCVCVCDINRFSLKRHVPPNEIIIRKAVSS